MFTSSNIILRYRPSSKGKWGTFGALDSSLDDLQLLQLAGRLNGSLLRMGGSPADFLVYETNPNACSAANLNRTQTKGPGGYFCPIWDQAPGQCLTMARWSEINRFAMRTGLHILFDLNACWGRASSDGAMDMTLIQGQLNATATMAALAVFGFLFGNELYTNVAAQRYG